MCLNNFLNKEALSSCSFSAGSFYCAWILCAILGASSVVHKRITKRNDHTT